MIKLIITCAMAYAGVLLYCAAGGILISIAAVYLLWIFQPGNGLWAMMTILGGGLTCSWKK